MTKDNFPSFIDWTYKKWYFWVLVILWTVWSTFGSLDEVSYLFELIGVVIFVFIFLSAIFFISYLISKNNCKKLGHI